MAGGASTGAAVTTGGISARAGPASWRDLGAIVRLYRAQPAGSRLFYHPFPFDRTRLGGVLAAIVVLQSARRRTVRRLPALAPLLWVVRSSDPDRVLGFGTATFHRDAGGTLVVRTGLFVAPDARRLGVGRLLKQTLLAESAQLGARRAEAILVAANEPSRELNRSLGYRLRPTEFHDPRAPGV
ncbi:MAG TPA: GNAT family N-acetyltransferase, partial [Thermoplasmata archaeon]